MTAMLGHSHSELKGAEFVVFVDSSRRYVDCTEAVCALLDYTRQEFVSMSIDEVSYNIAEVPELFALFLKSGALEGIYVLRRRDETPIPIRFKSFVLEDGCKAAIWELIKDWRPSYLAALLELDASKLSRRIDEARADINAARGAPGPISQDPSEQQAMNDADSALNALARRLKPMPLPTVR